jgi:hypothetical protein
MADEPVFTAAADRARLDWGMVYIAEAHATDEWPISSSRFNGDEGPVNVPQPKSTEERCDVARQFARRFVKGDGAERIKLLVDPLLPRDGERLQSEQKLVEPFEEAFAPWPLRLYVVQDGKLLYKAQPDSCSYDIAHFRSWLIAHIAEPIAARQEKEEEEAEEEAEAEEEEQ